jgi:stalled ribosome rescue protein Dom34
VSTEERGQENKYRCSLTHEVSYHFLATEADGADDSALFQTKEESMKKVAGLWIDHREAVIVTIADDEEKTNRIESGMETHTRFSGGSRSEQGGGEDQQDRQFTKHLNSYYDEVIAHLRDAESILIFGPGEAKGELEKRLAGKGLRGRVVGSETADKMTDRQIAAKVRQQLQK